MTQAEKRALAAQQKSAPVAKFTGDMASISDLAYGEKLWEVIQDIVVGKCVNTADNALPFGSDVSKLAAPAIYYAESMYTGKDGEPNLQLLLKPDPKTNTVYYAGILRDKDGDPITSDTDEYTVSEVRARREFVIKGSLDEKTGREHVIVEGFHALKAYAE